MSGQFALAELRQRIAELEARVAALEPKPKCPICNGSGFRSVASTFTFEPCDHKSKS